MCEGEKDIGGEGFMKLSKKCLTILNELMKKQ
jgi:hypothetical protein